MKYLRLACITCSLILLGIVLYSDIESDVIKYSIVLFFIAFSIMWYNFKDLRI
jgi:hypothetical protein